VEEKLVELSEIPPPKAGGLLPKNWSVKLQLDFELVRKNLVNLKSKIPTQAGVHTPINRSTISGASIGSIVKMLRINRATTK
jgi:hypothetical protein